MIQQDCEIPLILPLATTDLLHEMCRLRLECTYMQSDHVVNCSFIGFYNWKPIHCYFGNAICFDHRQQF